MLRLFCKKIFQNILIGLLCSLGFSSIAFSQYKNSTNVIGVRAPVWTEKLGNVPLDQYTERELDQMVREFWTPERMKNAIPMERGMKENFTQDQYLNNLFTIQETPETILSLPAAIDYKNNYQPKNNEQTDPKNPNGKIFAYDPESGGLFFCSGSAINSESKRIVATAAHCVHEGENNIWHSNWYFFPDYHEGYVPYGGFTPFIFWVLPAWVNQTSFYQGNNSDVAFVTTNTNHQNLRVVEAVGGHGIVANGGGYNFNTKIFGYPGNLQAGQVMYSYAGNTYQRLASGYYFVSINGCNFGQGASGGPWLEQYNPATKEGVLRGISSWLVCRNNSKPCNNVRHINSPYFSSDIIDLFNSANSADW